MQVKWKSFAAALAAATVLAGVLMALEAARIWSTLAAPVQGQVDEKRLMAAGKHPGGWLTTGRDFGKGHYSPLDQVNAGNVARLGFAWQYDTKTIRGLEATPIVVDGVMYTSGSIGQVYALDAKTGREIWTYSPHNDMRVNQRSC